ncbi:MAG: PHP domain-containing protein [Clostridia bacterium]|nr:PHP domain-containing protein [Clostridia bacterium]
MTTYDLHIHSCLSPCGDDDMTVNNIAGMAKIKNLRAAALTDHNTCMNVRAFECACEQYGVVAIPGMEITTSEEIHLLVYFRSVDDAERFEAEFDKYRTKIKNRVDLFGHQQILDKDDKVIGEYEYLLSVASALSVDEVYEMASRYDAACVPAHIDKTSNGMIGILGMMPEAPVFDCVEIKDISKKEEIFSKNPILENTPVISDSDAHLLWDINEAVNFLPVSAHGTSHEVRNRIIDYLRGEK